VLSWKTAHTFLEALSFFGRASLRKNRSHFSGSTLFFWSCFFTKKPLTLFRKHSLFLVVLLYGKTAHTFPEALSFLVVLLYGKTAHTFPEALSFLVALLFGKTAHTFPEALSFLVALLFGKTAHTFPEALSQNATLLWRRQLTFACG
jgi:hypothetical protein